MRKALVLASAVTLCPGLSSAQEAARFGVDSAVAVDLFRGENAPARPNIIIDVTAVVRLGGGWVAYGRPWFRQPRAATWDNQIYQAAVQHERPGPVSTRLDFGYIVSPIGLGMMDTRPGVNPTILPHLSYFTPMPAFEAGAPRVQPLASTYPLGGQLTVSSSGWDARVAVLASAPTRIYVINGARNPRSRPALVAGAGVAPRAGLRLGVSVARGEWATRGEIAARPAEGRDVTIVAFEGEYAVGHTRVAAEVVGDRFETAGAPVRAYAWFVQGMRTLSPRWFLAGRHEGVSAPPTTTGTAVGTRASFQTTEATLGYRVTPEVTLRSSFANRKIFTRSTRDQQVGVSLVWARRWW
jgi:hypothetical protein